MRVQVSDQTSVGDSCLAIHKVYTRYEFFQQQSASAPHEAAFTGRHVHVRDQREQRRQFVLCSVCDHHSESESGRGDVRKQR